MKIKQKSALTGVGDGYSAPETILVLIHQTDPLCTSTGAGTTDNYEEEILDWDE